MRTMPRFAMRLLLRADDAALRDDVHAVANELPQRARQER